MLCFLIQRQFSLMDWQVMSWKSLRHIYVPVVACVHFLLLLFSGGTHPDAAVCPGIMKAVWRIFWKMVELFRLRLCDIFRNYEHMKTPHPGIRKTIIDAPFCLPQTHSFNFLLVYKFSLGYFQGLILGCIFINHCVAFICICSGLGEVWCVCSAGGLRSFKAL